MYRMELPLQHLTQLTKVIKFGSLWVLSSSLILHINVYHSTFRLRLSGQAGQEWFESHQHRCTDFRQLDRVQRRRNKALVHDSAMAFWNGRANLLPGVQYIRIERSIDGPRSRCLNVYWRLKESLNFAELLAKHFTDVLAGMPCLLVALYLCLHSSPSKSDQAQSVAKGWSDSSCRCFEDTEQQHRDRCPPLLRAACSALPTYLKCCLEFCRTKAGFSTAEL